MAAVKIKLSNIEWIEVRDLSNGAKIHYERENPDDIEFAITYIYDNVEDGMSFCERCGSIYEDPEQTHTCPNCKPDDYYVMDNCEIPTMVYESIDDNYEVLIKEYNSDIMRFCLNK